MDVHDQAYISGWTISTDFPTPNSYQAHNAGGADSFITRLSADGSQYVYSTYIGGSGNDYNRGIAVDADGNAYVTGATTSLDFPTRHPFQAQYGGGAFDGFVSELNTTGYHLLYSTYLGGSNDDRGNAIALNGDDHIFIAGQTSSTDFPLQNPVQGTYGGGPFDGFVAKLDVNNQTNSSTLDYSTYLGGSGEDEATSLAVDGAGRAYVSGAASPNFPIANAVQPNYGGGPSDSFLPRLDNAHLPTPLPTPVRTDCGNQFTDIYGNTFYGEILDLYCRGIVSGTDPTHFSPDHPASRAEVIRVLIKAFGWPTNAPQDGSHTFSDVPPSNFAFPAIETAYRAGILSGFDQQSCITAGAAYPCYLPNHWVTRAQLTKLTVRAARFPLTTPTGGQQTFTDVPPSNTFYVFIETAAARHVVLGYPDGTFLPNAAVHRDAMSGIVDRALNQ